MVSVSGLVNARVINLRFTLAQWEGVVRIVFYHFAWHSYFSVSHLTLLKLYRPIVSLGFVLTLMKTNILFLSYFMSVNFSLTNNSCRRYCVDDIMSVSKTLKIPFYSHIHVTNFLTLDSEDKISMLLFAYHTDLLWELNVRLQASPENWFA